MALDVFPCNPSVYGVVKCFGLFDCCINGRRGLLNSNDWLSYFFSQRLTVYGRECALDGTVVVRGISGVDLLCEKKCSSSFDEFELSSLSVFTSKGDQVKTFPFRMLRWLVPLPFERYVSLIPSVGKWVFLGILLVAWIEIGTHITMVSRVTVLPHGGVSFMPVPQGWQGWHLMIVLSLPINL